MILEVEHRMHFHYDGFVRESQMELRVEPRSSRHQTVHAFRLAVGPPGSVERYADWNDNVVHHLGIRGYHDRIEIAAHARVDVIRDHPELETLAAPPAPGEGALLDFRLFGGPVVRGPALEALASELAVSPQAPLGEQLAAVGSLVRGRIEYRPGTTDWRSTVDEVLATGSGVCQDFAHVTLGLLRLRGIAARYVSGYLHVEGDEPAQSHAWVEVHAGAHDWVGYDPTHERVPREHYVTIATGRHYDDVPPNRGVFRGLARETLETEVRTRPGRPLDVAGLWEQVVELDVPVYAEIAAARRAPGPGVEEQPAGPAEPRQQQQQQQQR